MNTTTRWSPILLVTVAALLVAGCERPPMESVQRGYRGLGMEQIFNPRLVQANVSSTKLPDVLPPVDAGGPKATEVYKNVQVLNDLSVAEFTRVMVAITAWVAPPEQSCNYCHAPGEDLSSDKLYTKVVARRMLQMNRHVNNDWKTHVGNTGVTCFTCHRGNPVPAHVWFSDPKSLVAAGFAGNRYGQNAPAPAVNLSSLPSDPFTPFLKTAGEVRVVGKQALPAGKGESIQHTEWTYGLMMHMSQALGVNCTFCHNTRSFAEWDASTPQRVTAWYGLRMVRDLNVGYLEPLTATFPASRRGPSGDVAKVGCDTCHAGAYKPFYGAQLAKDYPALSGGVTVAAAAAAALPADVIGRILFETDKADLSADGRAVVDKVAAAMKANAALRVDVSGFADPSGGGASDRNLELAKQRAFAVRDALKAAGIAEDRIALRKPEFIVAGAVAAESRRVDVVAAK